MMLLLLLAASGTAASRTAASGATADNGATDASGATAAKAQLPIWPLPASWTAGTGTSAVVPSFGLTTATPSAELQAAFARFRLRAFPRPAAATAATAGPVGASSTAAAGPSGAVALLTFLAVTVANSSAPLALGVDESYELAIPASGNATLAVATLFGAYHGLETLSQLVAFDFNSEAYSIRNVLPLKIADKPRFRHRGLLLDTARHFQPVPALLQVIDSIATAKLNVFHWHISEDQSYPAASRAYPELPAKGAWSASERYTWRDLQAVVAFGRARGVRVLLELDMPGHATSWKHSHPELFSTGAPSGGSGAAACGVQVDGAPPNVTRAALDPAKNSTFEFIEGLLADYFDEDSGAFSDKFVHLGADEVPTGCWNNPTDAAFIKQNQLGDSAGLFSYFVSRVHAIARSLDKRVVMWDAAFNKGSKPPPKDVVIQLWTCFSDSSCLQLLLQIVRAGYDVIVSPDIPWYLNVVEPKDALCNTQWRCIYKYDPAAGMSAQEAAHVLGGEGALWGETVDASDLLPTLWPRLGAIAERLWSPAVSLEQQGGAMELRLRAFRCLLLQRGFGAGPVGDSVGDPSVAPFQRLHGPPGPGSCMQDS